MLLGPTYVEARERTDSRERKRTEKEKSVCLGKRETRERKEDCGLHRRKLPEKIEPERESFQPNGKWPKWAALIGHSKFFFGKKKG